MQCKGCLTHLKEGSKFCHSCGTKVIIERKCVECSHLLDHDEVFCSHCGAKFFETSEEGITNSFGNSVANLNLAPLYSVTGQGEDVYYIDNMKIYKLRDNEIEKVFEIDNGCISALNVIGDNLYFSKTNSIYTVKTNGSKLTLLFDVTKLKTHAIGYINFLIVSGEWIYFASTGSLTPFIARIKTNGEHFQIIYEPIKEELRNENDNYADNNIDIIDISQKWIFFKLDGSISKKLIISTDGKECMALHQFFDFCKILNRYPDENETITEIMENFEWKIVKVDFENKWLYFDSHAHTSTNRERVSFDGEYREIYWKKADWENQTNNPSLDRPNRYYLDHYFDWQGISVGFCYGGPHYYSLFRIYPDGRVVCLGGDGGSGCSELQIVGEWAYWSNHGKRRQNINTFEEQRLNLIELKFEKV